MSMMQSQIVYLINIKIEWSLYLLSPILQKYIEVLIMGRGNSGLYKTPRKH